jgi:hypothetical protein
LYHFADEQRIEQFTQRKAVRLDAWGTAGEEVVALLLGFFRRAVGIVPGSEVMELAANLLRPPARGVREQGKVG